MVSNEVQIYEKLAAALDRLPNGFPRTPSNVEISLLKKIFSLEEASLGGQLTGHMEPVSSIAERIVVPVQEVRARLMKMARRGLVWLRMQAGKPEFRLAPFIVGIYEAQVDIMDHEFAHLFEEYMLSGGAVAIMKPQPALHRVLPARHAVKSEWVLPYDDVQAILRMAKGFRIRDCICRVQQDHIGRKCDFPLRTCISFSSVERSSGPDAVSQDDALAILDQTEKVGLVHTVSNVIHGIGYVCNCCGCCCGILRGITEWGIVNSVAHANYFAVIDPDQCQDCGICVGRCQVRAISERDGVSVIDRARCIGCGLCVTGCPHGVARLQKKPESEIVHPPVDYQTWETERSLDRKLKTP